MTHLPLTFKDNVFTIGDTVRVMRSFYPHLSEGELCEVVGYEPRYVDQQGHFTWPAYVKVKHGDSISTYHASRFEKVEAA